MNSESKQKIIEFMDHETDEIEFDFCNPNFVIEYLKQIHEFDEDVFELETNGWQWDFWKKLLIDGEMYMLSGCGYYGTMRLRRDNV